MNGAEYLTHLYNRAAQRYGYASHAEYCADVGENYKRWRAKVEAEAKADREAWAKAQLDTD